MARAPRRAEKPAPASEQEHDPDRRFWVMTHDGPAPLANRIAIQSTRAGLRLTFAEQYDEDAPVSFRAAVLLTDIQAFELWELLGQNTHVTEAGKIVKEYRALLESESDAQP